ncbi:MAG: ATP-binding protein [Gammaproteobacteria bacterium]|nr:ATP-binding protein [Gammaproteobacteria bacterium]
MSPKTLTKPDIGTNSTKAAIPASFIKEVNLDWTLDSGTMHLTTELLRSRNEQQQEAEKATCLANRMVRLLEVLPGGVVVLDGNGYIQQYNLAAVNLLGEPLEGQLWANIILRAFSSNANDSNDVALKDGRLVHISTSPLDGEPGQIVLLHDVTETRQLQLKVSHLQRLSAMGEMAARLAHQIRTPLSSALLYIAPLLKQGTDKKTQLRFAQKLHSSISHMERLVKDMLAFSRGDMAKTEPVSVAEIVHAVEQQFYSQSDSDKLSFQVYNSVDDGTIYGSKDALTSAINNLVTNARLACEQEGEITLYVEHVEDERGADCIEISVEDNGVGIPEQEQSRILKPFYTTRSSGTGLGLAVVQSIVTAHRGTLWFASDEGEGSTFSLRLPMYQSVEKFTLKIQKQ